MKPELMIDIKEQCAKADAHFFFKKWGDRNKKKARRKLAGTTWRDIPAMPAGFAF